MIVAAENDNTVLVNFCIHKGANNFNEAMVGGGGSMWRLHGHNSFNDRPWRRCLLLVAGFTVFTK